jgi:hypothetical protein
MDEAIRSCSGISLSSIIISEEKYATCPIAKGTKAGGRHDAADAGRAAGAGQQLDPDLLERLKWDSVPKGWSR